MDPLSHALIGGLTAKTLRTSQRRFWIMSILAMAPDLDVLASGLGSWAASLQHRGLTHSILGVWVMAAGFSLIFRRWDQGPFWPRAGQYSLSLFSHLAGDLLTSFGVPLLAPFSYRGYCLDLLGSVSPLPIIVLAAGLAWLHYQNRNGWRSTVLLWSFLGLYLTATISGRSYAGSLLPAGVTPIPSTANPFSWRAVQANSHDHAYHTFRTNLITGRHWRETDVPMPSHDYPVWVSSRSPLVRGFLAENRWPVVRVLPLAGGWRVEWGTLLFSTRGLVRGKVAVELSSSGELLTDEKIFNFWNPS